MELSWNDPETIKYLTEQARRKKFDDHQYWPTVAAQIKRNDSILDWGCGVGTGLRALSRLGVKFSHYHGVDIHAELIGEAARLHGNHKRISFQTRDEFTPRGKYGVMILSDLAMHYENLEDSLKLEILRANPEKAIIVTRVGDIGKTVSVPAKAAGGGEWIYTYHAPAEMERAMSPELKMEKAILDRHGGDLYFAVYVFLNKAG